MDMIRPLAKEKADFESPLTWRARHHVELDSLYGFACLGTSGTKRKRTKILKNEKATKRGGGGDAP